MFTIEERKIALQNLFQYFSRIEEVKAIALVGSIAREEFDRYSDIDLSIIIDDEAVEKIWINAEGFLKKVFNCFKIFKQVYGEKDLLVGVFLNNCLEIDIGFTSQAKFEAKSISKENLKYKFLYKRKDFFIEENEFHPNHNIGTLLNARVNDMWYDFKNAIIALKRGNLFRAVKSIEQIRDQILEFHTKLNGLELKHFKGVDKLSDYIKDKIKEAHFSEISYPELRRSLIAYLMLFVEDLSSFDRKQDGEEYLALFKRFIEEVDL